MPLTNIAYIDVRFFVHATEDQRKVVEAVHHILPARYVENVVFNRNDLRGHYGNSISVFETRITNKEILKDIVESVSSRLNRLDKETLLREVNLHIAKGSLYIRLDKQAAFMGELRLCAADPVHIRIRFKRKKAEDIIPICRELGMLYERVCRSPPAPID